MPTRNFQFGYATETTYGVRATPDKFIEPNSYGLTVDIERIEARGLRAGTTVNSSTRWSSGKQTIGGPFEFYAPYRGAGGLYKALLGSSNITTPTGGTNSRSHVYTIGSSLPSLTIQEVIPDASNTARMWDFLGCMVASASFSNDTDNALTVGMEVIGSSYSTAQSQASASYGANDGIFTFTGATISVAGSSYQTKSINVNVSNSLDRRFYLGSASTAQPLSTDLMEITGEIESDYIDNTAVNRFLSGTTASIVASWQGDLIEGSLYNRFTITMPVCRFDGATPTVDGPELVPQSLPFKVLSDGSQEPITIEWVTRDTTD